MKKYHLNCGTLNVMGGVSVVGTGGLFKRANAVVHCILVETDDGLMLIDTGIGTQDIENPTFLTNLFWTMSGSPRDLNETALYQVRRLGYAPEDVKHIVVTHFHFDHVGGLPDFPWAKVHIYEDELSRVRYPTNIYERYVYRPEHHAHNPGWVVHRCHGDTWFGFDRTPIVDMGNTLFFFVPMPGHSHGMSGVALRTEDGWVFHCGDAYAYHKDVDPVDPQKPPHYGIWKLIILSNPVMGAIGKHSPRLRELVNQHGDEVTLTCSHDPVEWAKFQTN